MSHVLPQDPGSPDHSGDLDLKNGKDGARLTDGRPSDAEGESADQMLEHLGYTPELSRNRSTAQVAFMSFVLASIPYGLATTMIYPLIGGGPVNIIWGWLLVSCIILCVAASLGEITSVYPTAGGVYYQAFMLAPAAWRRATAWICGWLYVVGNITITLAVNFGTTLFFVACINVFKGEPYMTEVDGVMVETQDGVFAGEAYQVFLIFLAITFLCNLVSALGNRWLPWLDTAAIFWTFAGLFAIVISVLAIAKNGRHDAAYVFGHFEANSGWPDGWSFCVGLLHAGYATSSTGMIISMCEEVQKPATQVPKAMVATIFINTFAGLLFLIPLVFVLPDITYLISLASGQPVPEIILSAVGAPGPAIALLIPLMVLAIMCGICCTTAASRCTWAFARDGAIPGASWWRVVNNKLDVPLNAMMLSMVVQIVLSLIYFGSSAAFNAFSGVGVICLTASYATPIAINLFTGRRQVQGAPFPLRGGLGYFCNIVALAWSALAMPLFCMPSIVPVTATTVNYAPVVFVSATLISAGWYIAWGKKHYTGPPIQDPAH
ncbi:choline transporter [Gaeumannomyces tritici R3-111a-1]|uniref:Choline transporter n=1 Tax=Gaeumannomyces tritici (strain R3-111a-1) TaxID=644352 RepID=J3PJX6_GAET3|nr:choline transporter [Gaeumannomyces tritici R3-111a-1]EJT68606.1 choline transporter [Gaeumannomyces tritici R3-111a-1]